MSTLLEQAIERIKAGDVAAARSLLAQELKRNPRNEYAWMASSYCVSDISQKRYCLNKVLEINPNNENARKELGKLSLPQASPAQPPISDKQSSFLSSHPQHAIPVAPSPKIFTPPVKDSASNTQSATPHLAQAPAHIVAQSARQKQQSASKNTRQQKKKGLSPAIWGSIIVALIGLCGTLITVALNPDLISVIMGMVSPRADNFTISIHVAEQGGNSVSGAKVIFFYPSGSLSQYTDSTGVSTFTVNNAGQGNIRIIVESDNYQIFEKQVLYPIETTVDVRLKEKEATTENVVLRTITEGSAKPIANSEIAISVNGSIYRETTDSDGFAVLSLPFSDSGRIDTRISVKAKGYELEDQFGTLTPGKLQYVVLTPNSLKIENPDIPVSSANTVLVVQSVPTPIQTMSTEKIIGSGVEVTQESGGSGIKIIFLDPSSQPAPGSEISLYKQITDVVGNPSKGDKVSFEISFWDLNVRSMKINEQGELNIFDLAEGIYVVCSSLTPGYGWTNEDCVYNVQSTTNSLTIVKFQLGQIKFAIVDADGNPWENVDCQIFTEKKDVSGKSVVDNRVWNGHTDNTGTLYAWLTPGIYAVNVDLRGYNWGDLSETLGQSSVVVQKGSTTSLFLEMGQIKFGLIDSSGEPRTNISIEVFTQKSDVNGNPVLDDRVWSGNTDNGGFTWVDLTEGFYAIEIDGIIFYNIPVNWGGVTEFDGKTYHQNK